ncbi:hypothetical protein ACFFRR_001629 [Megaselia abdita]
MQQSESRKRLRSDESSPVFSNQTKVFVNPQIAIKSDKKEMDKIHGKTINLLFKGAAAKTVEPENSPVKVKINGTGVIEIPKKPEDKDAKEGKKNKCCLKPSKLEGIACANCGLAICEFCGFSCSSGCNKFLCRNCIVLFDCGTLEEPKCENCKLFV